MPVDGFEWVEDLSKIDEDFIKNYDEDSNVGYFIKADIEYPKELYNKHSDLPFLPERMKVNKCKKLVCNLHDKKDYVDHIRSLKQALNNGLKIKKIHRVLKFNQSAWLKSYIDMIHKPLRMDVSSRKGELLVYIKSSLPSKMLINFKLVDNIETTSLVSNLKKEKWLFGSIYKPPLQNNECFVSILNNLLDFYSNEYDNKVVLGDFNLEPLNPSMLSFMDC